MKAFVPIAKIEDDIHLRFLMFRRLDIEKSRGNEFSH